MSMSYSILEARGERAKEVKEAIEGRDEETLFKLGGLFAKEGDVEYAETLRNLAHKAYKESWAYDEARDNELTSA